jgi:GntR family transcriptional repressor for pyruvate dehydrogenase complex
VAAPTSRVRVWRGITQEGAIERTLGEHRAIVAALGCTTRH